MLMNKLRQILTFARKKPLIFILDSIVAILSVLLFYKRKQFFVFKLIVYAING